MFLRITALSGEFYEFREFSVERIKLNRGAIESLRFILNSVLARFTFPRRNNELLHI